MLIIFRDTKVTDEMEEFTNSDFRFIGGKRSFEFELNHFIGINKLPLPTVFTASSLHSKKNPSQPKTYR